MLMRHAEAGKHGLSMLISPYERICARLLTRRLLYWHQQASYCSQRRFTMTDERTPQGDSSFHVQANIVGAIGPGAHGEVHQHFYPPAVQPSASRPARDRLPLQPNQFFQERIGEFEALEQLLFGQQGSGRVGLVGVGVVGMDGIWKTYPAV